MYVQTHALVGKCAHQHALGFSVWSLKALYALFFIRALFLRSQLSGPMLNKQASVLLKMPGTQLQGASQVTLEEMPGAQSKSADILPVSGILRSFWFENRGML
jgi:hypothetical protein